MQFSGTSLEDIKNSDIGVTIGSFDGVHKGHQYILDEFVYKCAKKNLRPVVISFTPHPLVVIKNLENFLIDSSHKKRIYLKRRFDIDLVEVQFDEKLREMSGESFFKELIKQMKNIKLFYAGHDFSLGRGKEFTVVEAKKLLTSVEIVEGSKYTSNEFTFSSSAIRECLQKGEIQKANFLLGHPFKITAIVVDGSKIGRTIGFPTANLNFCKTQILPQDGVYFAKAIYKEKDYSALVNIGIRPTVSKDKIRVVEVNLFNFDEDIYAEELDVEFYHKIRSEKKFSSIEELKIQIQKDKEVCQGLYFYGRFGLVGKDISHSRSSNIYSRLISNSHIDYQLYDFENSSLINLTFILKKTPYLSVTSPYKNVAYNMCDTFEGPDAIVSANCIKIEGNKVIGTNTDLLGMEDILSTLEVENYSKIYILGSGAMSDLLCFILDRKGHSFSILSRKNSKLDMLPSLDEDNVLVINATSRSFIPVLSNTLSGVFWDLNYAQAYADKFNENKKVKYIDGESLLMLQAKYALSFWNLKSP